MSISNSDLINWTKPGFDNEQERADNTKKAVQAAIQNHNVLKSLSISVFPKGSYANNTNVRRDSDIDIAVRLNNLIVPEYFNGVTQQSAGLSAYTGISKANFKSYLLEALQNEFGVGAIDANGNKVFRVRKSAKILDADVIPCTSYRRYFSNTSFREGIALIPNNPLPSLCVNYPQQHYDNGVSKNLRTKKRYKSLVRILKNIRNNVLNRKDYASFMLESLVYNSSDEVLLKYNTWNEIIVNLCGHAYEYLNRVEPQTESQRWFEVNHHKFLFHPSQRWTREDAKQFILDLYNSIS